MKVWVVIYQDWDTEGQTSPPKVVGVYSDVDKIPDKFMTQNSSYECYYMEEVEVDKPLDSWL